MIEAVVTFQVCDVRVRRIVVTQVGRCLVHYHIIPAPIMDQVITVHLQAKQEQDYIVSVGRSKKSLDYPSSFYKTV